MIQLRRVKQTRPVERPPVYVPGLGGYDGAAPGGSPALRPHKRKWIFVGVVGCFALLLIALGSMGGGASKSGSTSVAATVTKTVTSTVLAPAETVLAQAPISTVTITEATPAPPPAAFVAPPVVEAPQAPVPPYVEAPPTVEAPASANYQNCSAARAAGAAPIYAGEPGYSSKLDGDGDGVACE